MDKPAKIASPKGKLGVLLPGMGAVSTTFMAGVELVRKGHAKPVGSLTQLGTIRLGKRTDNHSPQIKKFVPLAELDDLARVAPDLVDLDHVLGSHAVLLTAGSDDCEHRFWSSCSMRPDRFLPVG